ncbi:galactose oxidase [Melanomma pulvis-pyrius CBS 109.77]|uniref:Galactose oxidase n=1 Tax=Melanomma pulvis-pyrius CBS 109.77 TaxID=1314802 RepID=A0A6A6X0R3_9PLEO|nr:galactose oxidase [Melanomma pulvis-pyrius CBS 109.77]
MKHMPHSRVSQLTMLTFNALVLLSSVSIALSHPSPPSTWTPLANISVAPRQEHSTIFLPPSTIGILGGVIPVAGEMLPLTTGMIQFYSIPENIWKTVSPIPKPVNHLNAAVVNGKIYVLGGLAMTTTENGSPVWMHTSDSWVYNPKSDSWTSLPAMPDAEARGSAGVGVYGGKVILAGGLRSLELVPGGLQDTVDTVSIFDTVTKKWLEVPEAAKKIPEGRDHAGAAAVGSKMYILGGRNMGQENVKDTVFILDLKNLERGWKTSKAKMPTPRGGCATGVIGTKVYIFGGEGNTQAASGVFNETEAYDTVRDRWEQFAPMRIPRHGTYAVGVRNSVYIPGGGIAQSSGPVADFDVFRP